QRFQLLAQQHGEFDSQFLRPFCINGRLRLGAHVPEYPIHATNRPRLCSIQYIMYFAVRGLTLLRHPLKDVLDRLRFELASIARACAVLLCEQDVVILLAFERWVDMKRDMDLFRALLLEIEKLPANGKWTGIEVEGYSPEEVAYHI